MRDVKKKYPDQHKSDIVQNIYKKHAETNEAAVKEISKNLARKYVNKAAIDLFHKGQAQGAADTIAKAGGKHPDQKYTGGPEFKGARRVGGIQRATRKLMKKEAYTTSADRKPENVTGPDGKVRVRMVPVRKKSAESTIGYGKAMVKTQRDQKKALITPKDKSTLGKLASLMAKQPKRKS